MSLRTLLPYPKMVILIRHGESEANLLSRDEQRDIPYGTNHYRLTEKGRRQAELTGNWVRANLPKPDLILRSYYARTNETAELVFPGREIRDEVLLAERDRGIWTEATEEEVREHAPWEIRRRDKQGSYHYRPAGGENIPDVERRVREFRRSMRVNSGHKIIAAVGHSHWILLWQKVVHHWSIEETEADFHRKDWVRNASVLIYRNHWDPELGEHRLIHNRDVDHIVPWEGKL